MSITNYKCIGCSAPISFNPKIGGFKCEYCGRTCTEQELQDFVAQTEEKWAEKHAHETHDDGSEIRQYHCPNCGAEVVCGDTTTASFCYYCHSPVIIESRLQGDFRPDKIIPFQIDQKTAVAKFSQWISGKKFLPKDFTVKNQKDNIIGLYLPYWDIDVNVAVNYHAVGINEHRRLRGDREEITTERYRIERGGTMHMPAIRFLSFNKINQHLIHAINPFNAVDETAFNTGYLSGFQSERFTLPQDEASQYARQQAQQHAVSQLRATSGCERILDEDDRSEYAIDKVAYTLLPVYILQYHYKGVDYQFAVNGQTGVAAGDLPTDTVRVSIFAVIIGLIVLILALLGGFFLW